MTVSKTILSFVVYRVWKQFDQNDKKFPLCAVYQKIVITFEEDKFMEQMISEVLLLEKTEGVNIDHLREMLKKMAESNAK